jgi:hypothetical protein
MINLGCEVERITYDFQKHVAHVYMPEGNCTDMSRTIDFFQRLDKNVGHIHTWQANKVDTQYVLPPNSDWIAI